VYRQVRGLLEGVKQTQDQGTQIGLLLEAEKKATGLVQEDARYIPGWVALAKVAWYFGEAQRVAELDKRVADLRPAGIYDDMVSELRWLRANPLADPLKRPQPSIYEQLVREAQDAEQAGRVAEARKLYYSAHDLQPDGPQEAAISDALLRLTIPLAKQRRDAGDWGEAARLVGDYLEAYQGADQPNEDALYIAVVAAQKLNRPSDMNQWAQAYRRCFPTGAHIQEIEKLLGEVNAAAYGELVNRTVIALRAGVTHDAATKLIKAAEECAVAGVGAAETDYLWGIHYAYCPEPEDVRARDCFKAYLAKAPNGPYRRDAYDALWRLGEPLLLFTARKAGSSNPAELLLWTVRRDGSGARPITSEQQGYIATTAGGEPLVAVSPDSRRLAFATRSPGQVTLFVTNAAGKEPKAIWMSSVPEDVQHISGLQWAPQSGSFLKFHAPEPGGDGYLWLWGPNAEKARPELTSRTARAQADKLVSQWSPDGKWLAWVADNETLHYGLEPFAAFERIVHQGPSPGFDPRVRNFMWALPTHMKAGCPILVGCTSTHAFKVDFQPGSIVTKTWGYLGALKKGGKGVEQIVPKAHITSIGCSSGGDYVAFLTQAGVLSLYRLRPDPTPDKGPRELRAMDWVRNEPERDDMGPVNEFRFSPLGGRLAYRTSGPPGRVWIAGFSEYHEADREVAGSDGTTQFFWSPDQGQLLTATSNLLTITYDRQPLFRCTRPTDPEDTPAVAGTGWLNPQWSPDGNVIAITKHDGAGTDLVLARREGTITDPRWVNLVPPSCEAGTLQVVGWLRAE